MTNTANRHYQDVEMGRVNPSLSVAIRIAAVLDVGLDSLKSEV
ncbi:helix-turn-helix domain-containing protein [Ligaoa zhengdingensis]